MKRLFIAIAFLSPLSAVSMYARADSEVYLCVDEHGKKVYQNTGASKGCKRVDLPGINVIPASTPVKKAVAVARASASSSSSSPGFPKIDESTQKSRDSDRRQILQEELKSEEQKLSDLKKEYNNGAPERRGDEKNFVKYQDRTTMLKDDVARTEKNVEALKREVSNLK